MQGFNRNPQRIQVPTEFALEPDDCDHRLHWYVTPNGTLCGTCGADLPKPEPKPIVHPYLLVQMMQENGFGGRR